MKKLFGIFTALLFICFFSGCATYKITSDPSGATVKFKNKKDITTSDFLAQKTPCRVVATGKLTGYDHVGVTWPNGTMSEWRPFNESQHFKQLDYDLKEPALWASATAFEKIGKGFFYEDLSTTARYSPPGDISLALKSVPKSVGMLDFSNPFSTGFRELQQGRLEDKFVYYHYLGLITTDSKRNIKVYQNAFGVKKELISYESKKIGVFFSNTASEASSGRISYKTSLVLLVDEFGHFSIPVTEDQANKIGREAVVRVYFTIENANETKDHIWGTVPTLDSLYTYCTEYTLYKAKLHGLRIIYEQLPYLNLLAVVQE